MCGLWASHIFSLVDIIIIIIIHTHTPSKLIKETLSPAIWVGNLAADGQSGRPPHGFLLITSEEDARVVLQLRPAGDLYPVRSHSRLRGLEGPTTNFVPRTRRRPTLYRGAS